MQARRLVARDRSDEEIERLTGLTLVEILVLRIEAATSRAARPWTPSSDRDA